ncbi:MAG TPA: hypothetical protein PLY02_02450 [Candidatus Pacearchaeota archaeon]|nr:hypothetical protein [Candidatus Pacearchaeota archaeon]HOK94373.1 hypothetical protein [Candidatus Pacearchaeota archaeon]
MKKNSEKSIASFLAITVVSILLAMVVGIMPILITQIKMVTGKEESTLAFYAADTGAERVLEAIEVGYDYYHYPSSYGQCIDVSGKKGCDYSVCQPVITFNDTFNCGLPSKCQGSSDCICPIDKCVGFNYYDYPSTGRCEGGQCFNCLPTVLTNDSRCNYNQSNPPSCEKNEDCSCPKNQCIGLDPSAIISSWETPYFDKFANGASYKTYIEKSAGKEIIKSIGSYAETKRAIEFSR